MRVGLRSSGPVAHRLRVTGFRTFRAVREESVSRVIVCNGRVRSVHLEANMRRDPERCDPRACARRAGAPTRPISAIRRVRECAHAPVRYPSLLPHGHSRRGVAALGDDELGLSAHAYHRRFGLTSTIAPAHVAEVIQHRALDRWRAAAGTPMTQLVRSISRGSGSGSTTLHLIVEKR